MRQCAPPKPHCSEDQHTVQHFTCSKLRKKNHRTYRVPVLKVEKGRDAGKNARRYQRPPEPQSVNLQNVNEHETPQARRSDCQRFPNRLVFSWNHTGCPMVSKQLTRSRGRHAGSGVQRQRQPACAVLQRTELVVHVPQRVHQVKQKHPHGDECSRVDQSPQFAFVDANVLSTQFLMDLHTFVSIDDT